MDFYNGGSGGPLLTRFLNFFWGKRPGGITPPSAAPEAEVVSASPLAIIAGQHQRAWRTTTTSIVSSRRPPLRVRTRQLEDKRDEGERRVVTMPRMHACRPSNSEKGAATSTRVRRARIQPGAAPRRTITITAPGPQRSSPTSTMPHGEQVVAESQHVLEDPRDGPIDLSQRRLALRAR